MCVYPPCYCVKKYKNSFLEMTLVEEVVCLCHIISRGRWMKKITVMEIEGKLSYCFSARLRNVTAAKWPDCRMALLQYGLTAICLYCNMATAIWPTAIWRRQNDAQPKGRGEGGWKSFSFHYCDIYTWNFVASNLCVLPCYLPFPFPSNEVCQPTTIMTCTWR